MKSVFKQSDMAGRFEAVDNFKADFNIRSLLRGQ